MKKNMQNNSNLQNSDRMIINTIIGRLDPRFKKKIKSEFPLLNETELAVCILLKAGFSNDKICEFLQLNAKQLENYYSGIYNKAAKNPKKVLLNLIKAF